jgi:hypothetical protein
VRESPISPFVFTSERGVAVPASGPALAAAPRRSRRSRSSSSSLLRSYNCGKVVGDRNVGEWPVDMFRRFNIRFEQTARPRSDLYVGLLASLNSRRVDLLDNPKLISQLCALEQRTARSGRDSVDYPPGGQRRRRQRGGGRRGGLPNRVRLRSKSRMASRGKYGWAAPSLSVGLTEKNAGPSQ